MALNLIAGFSRGKHVAPVSKLQMKIFKCDYSHEYVRFGLKLTNITLDLVFHATAMGIHVNSYKQFCIDRIPVYEFEVPINAKSFDDFVFYAFDVTGIKYGTCKMFFSGIARFLGIRKNIFGKRMDTYCSMAAEMAFEKFCNIEIPGAANLSIPKSNCDFFKAFPNKFACILRP